MDWFWEFKQTNSNATWFDVRIGILRYFCPDESEEQTKEMIIRKLQGAKESFSDFALDIQKLNGRLRNRLSDIEMMERLYQNMIPATSMHLRNVILASKSRINSIEELRMLCQRYERMWAQTGYDPRNFSYTTQRRRHLVNEMI